VHTSTTAGIARLTFASSYTTNNFAFTTNPHGTLITHT
jgi:hypothetical protein